MSLFAPAVKERLKARVAIDGPTGAGKTYTALQWARILAGDNPVGVIDTENRSAAYYAPSPSQRETLARVNPWDAPYDFGHLPQSPPYDPRQLSNIITAAATELGADGVLVIDSLTHFWNGEGGTLDIVDNASAKSGNSYTAWKEGTPAQRHLLDTIIHAGCHVIVTMRSKMVYELVEYVDGKGNKRSKPEKIGLAPEQRANIEYEFTVVADMDLEHRLIVSKSRCDVIADMVMPSGRSHEPAIAFRDWLDSGVQRLAPVQVEAITSLFAQVGNEAARKAVKAEFVATFGAPAELTTDRFDEAKQWAESSVSALVVPEREIPSISSSPVQPGRTYPTNPDPVYGEQDQGDELPYEPEPVH